MDSETACLLNGERRKPSLLREYSSLAVAVVENEDLQAVVVHDFSGAILTRKETFERRDSLTETISIAMEEQNLDIIPCEEEHGEATIASTIASMSKNLMGCGALSLSNGIAICANTHSATFTGNFLILLFGFIFGFMCYLIGEVCEMTGRRTYRGIWQETVGHRGSLAVSITNVVKAGMVDLAFASILSDTLKSLFAAAGQDVPRLACLLLVTVVAVLPLCLLKNLHVLAPFSVMGTAGIGLTAFAMAVRYYDGSYEPGGQYYADIDPSYRPDFGARSALFSSRILPFVCMVYEAYIIHYNAARFYNEMNNKSLPRFKIAVSASYTLAALMFMALASLGYATFGGNSAGFILNNYSPHDPLASVSRIAVGFSTLTAYPIVFFGVRDGVLDIFEVPLMDQTPERMNALTFALLSILTITAVFVTDLGLINAVGGGLVTVPIVFVFPAIMYRSAVKVYGGASSSDEGMKSDMASGLAVVSVFIGLIGAWMAVSNGMT